jgi:hypothetical protein
LLSFIDGARDNIILLSEKNITIDLDDVEKYACKIPEGFHSGQEDPRFGKY